MNPAGCGGEEEYAGKRGKDGARQFQPGWIRDHPPTVPADRLAGGLGFYSPTVISGFIFSMILSPIPFTLVRSSTVLKLPLAVR